MSETFDSKVTRFLEEFIRISQVPRFAKLRVKGDFIEVQLPSLLQGLWRWLGSDTKEDTRARLETLYKEAFGTCDLIMSMSELVEVLLPGRPYMTHEENKQYLQRKEWIDSLANRIEQSVPGLEHLNETYEMKETIFTILIDKSKKKVTQVRELTKKLDDAYMKMPILNPMMVHVGNVVTVQTAAATTAPAASLPQQQQPAAQGQAALDSAATMLSSSTSASVATAVAATTTT